MLNSAFMLEDQILRYVEAQRAYYAGVDMLMSKSTVEWLPSIARTLPQGDVVECGVWKGGSLRMLARLGRPIWGYDTYSGFTDSTGPKDVVVKPFLDYIYGGYPKIEQVQGYLLSHLVEGTLVQCDLSKSKPTAIPSRIALLHLDLDLYSPTLGALNTFYERVVPNGYVVVDDYGDERVNCKEAVDTYRATHGIEESMVMLGGAAAFWMKV